MPATCNEVETIMNIETNEIEENEAYMHKKWCLRYSRLESNFCWDFLFVSITIACLVCGLCLYLFIGNKNHGNNEKESGISSISYQGCGIRRVDPCKTKTSCRERRIIGGRPVINNWPWVVEILADGKHFCGGTLIAPNWVLTAAHCLRNREYALLPSQVTVRSGIINRLHPEGTSQESNVSRIIIHGGFSEHTFVNDIGLIQLSTNVTLTNNVWPSCLPTKGSDVDGNGVIAGWGKLQHDGPYATLLQELKIPVAPIGLCVNANHGLFTNVDVDRENNICVGSGKMSSSYGCMGDSGGPLSWQGDQDQWIVTGIISWGDPRCRSDEGTYTVLTKVSSYEEWIRHHIHLKDG